MTIDTKRVVSNPNLLVDETNDLLVDENGNNLWDGLPVEINTNWTPRI